MRLKSICLLFLLFGLNTASAQQFEWAINGYGYGTYMQVADVVTDAAGNSYMAGLYNGNHDFDPGPGIYTLNPSHSGRMYVAKYNSSGSLVWVKGFRSSPLGISNRFKINLDPSGNIYFAGHFYDSLYADPGPGTVLFTNADIEFDMFIIKLNNNGDYVWSAAFPCNNNSVILDLKTDSLGDVFLTGNFTGDVDFSPGPAQYILSTSPPNISTGFLVKLHSFGSLYYAQKIGGSDARVKSLLIFPNGEYYALGSFGSFGFDFDPGPANFILNAMNGSQFICRYTPQGAFINGWQIGASVSCATFDSDYNILFSGQVYGISDMDPGPGVYNLNPTGAKVYLSKLDSSMNLLWSFHWNSNLLYSQFAGSVACDSDNNIYVCGSAAGIVDTDPGSGNANLISSDSILNSFIVKYDPAGNHLRTIQFSGQSSTIPFPASISTDPYNNLYTRGHYYTTFDADPGNGLYTVGSSSAFGTGPHAYFIKLSADTCNNFSVGIDSVSSPTCTNPGYASAQALNGTPGYQYMWNTSPPANTSSVSLAAGGIYTVTVTDAAGCQSSSAVLLSGSSYASQPDLKLTGVTSGVIPGDTVYINLHVSNNGCVPAAGTLFLELGSDVTFLNSNPPPDLILGDSLLWFVNTIQYGDPALIYNVRVLADSALSQGDSVCFYGNITIPPNDANPGNNQIALCEAAQTAYDPNNKRVFPAGTCETHNVLKNEPLTYTIHFQNLGDTSAFNIRIIDTLDTSLDINRLVVTATSHPVITEVLPGNVLQFRFDDIYLPHSAASFQESMGYLVYEVMPDTTVPDQTVVTNEALIFFDFNLPVITNEVFNTLFTVLPALPDTTVTMNGITLNAVTGYTSYQWINCNTGFNVGTATSSSFTPWLNGSYKVRINNNGCVTTSGCHIVNSVGIDELLQRQLLQIHPNPAGEQFQLTVPEHMRGAVIQVFDVLGKVVLRESVPDNGIAEITTGQWQDGVYLVKVTWKDLILAEKLIKASGQ